MVRQAQILATLLLLGGTVCSETNATSAIGDEFGIERATNSWASASSSSSSSGSSASASASGGAYASSSSNGASSAYAYASSSSSSSPSSSYAVAYTSTSSTLGINEVSYTHFHFNGVFQSYTHDSFLTRYLSSYVGVVESLAEQVIAGTISVFRYNFWWKPFADATYEAYTQERGALIYEEGPFGEDPGRWTFCGWIHTRRTFLPISGVMQICLPLEAIRMEPIIRDAVPFSDYIPEGAVDYMRGLAGVGGSTRVMRYDNESNTDTGSDYGGEERYPPACPEGVDAAADGDCIPYRVVNLFASSEYASNCYEKSLDSNCYALCCLSAYITSGYCEYQGLAL